MSQTPRVVMNHHNYEAERAARQAHKTKIALKVEELESLELEQTADIVFHLLDEEELSALASLSETELEDFGLGGFLKSVVDKVTGKDKKKKDEEKEGQQGNGFDENEHKRGPDGRFVEMPEKKDKDKSFLAKAIDKVKTVVTAIPGGVIIQVIPPAKKDKTPAPPSFDQYELTETKPDKTGKIDGIQVKGSKWEITTKNGVKLAGYDYDDVSGHFTVEQRKKALSALAEVHETYPGKLKTTKILFQNAESVREDGHDPEGVAGWVMIPRSGHDDFDESVIHFNTSHPFMGRDVSDARTNMMPAFNKTGTERYIIFHETGHQYDAATNRTPITGVSSLFKSDTDEWNPKATKAVFSDPRVQASLSEYGRTSSSEAYAEAFAEWHATGGNTKNVAANAYAAHEGWKKGVLSDVKESEKKNTKYQVKSKEPRTIKNKDGSTTTIYPDGTKVSSGPVVSRY